MNNKTKNYFLFIEPKNKKIEPDLNDDITHYFSKIFEKAKQIPGSATKGFHLCACKAHSDNVNYNINIGGKTYVTNSLALHYIKNHRTEVPQIYLDIILSAMKKNNIKEIDIDNNFLEIERKFLVDEKNKDFIKSIKNSKKYLIEQGYLIEDNKEKSVVRVRKKDDKFYLTIKMNNKNQINKTIISKKEFEFEVEPKIGQEMLNNCFKFIKKTRHIIPFNGKNIEVDFFENGLILAEIELKNENENIKLPKWILEDVSNEEKYFNNNLAKRRI